MNHTQYRATLDRFGLTQAGAAELLAGVDPRTGRAWALGENKVPMAVAILLRLLITKKITVADVEAAKRGLMTMK